ncbi:low molecular weight protein-tyrosine-phosphatase [Dactylococcopsis salina]|uniref:protein-tyrosine-phosphatase n=1 Tax=Dactylococcopsis salina (strain PCC 8305) TaxID=13035 RepID=K9YV89_DACS8|nr:low molecular weight protein-tyrosine-phosphatase [Dactylococcopsis salina]AFZ50240.1 protein-tyrosine-phosphatase [Dactylococcopsis salina PCC 8305]
MYKLLFVCLGNICRSPSAENIMRYLIEKEGLSDQIVCDSAGTASYHLGEPPDQRMKAAAEKRGIKLEGKARQFQPSDFEKYDLILAMDRDNYWSLVSLDPEKKYREKIKMMCNYAKSYPDQEVPDPYYGGTEGFNHVIDLLLDACSELLESIKKD